MSIEQEKEKKVTKLAVYYFPVWLYNELDNEAEKYYGGSYAPVIIDWYRKAKEFENLTRGGLPEPDIKPVEYVKEKPKVKKLKLLGGNEVNL